jgi:putative ABC transport system ATP-binding protein
MTTAATVRTQGLVRTYGSGPRAVHALRGIDLDIAPGEAVAVAGASGSGKSTLLHLLGGMDRPDAGTIEVDGERVDRLRGKALDQHRRRVGFVFQRFNLLAALSALDNVVAPVLPRRVTFDKTARARELLAAVGLDERRNALPGKLSGGEQQRVAIARALIQEPALLLADEPTGNLDSATGDEILQLILELRAQRGMTVIIVTHDHSIAARCERVITLADGHVTDSTAVSGPRLASATDS